MFSSGDQTGKRERAEALESFGSRGGSKDECGGEGHRGEREGRGRVEDRGGRGRGRSSSFTSIPPGQANRECVHMWGSGNCVVCWPFAPPETHLVQAELLEKFQVDRWILAFHSGHADAS